MHPRQYLIRAFLVFALLIVAAGCERSERKEKVDADKAKASIAQSPAASRFDPDNEPSALTNDALIASFGPLPTAKKKYTFAAMMKFLGNQYWQFLAEGMQSRCRELGVFLEVQAAATESDPEGQLAIMQSMVAKGYSAILLSPQTDKNLVPAVQRARNAGILLVNVDDAVLEDAERFIGPNQYENGVRAAKYFLQRFPQGGNVAVIRGLAGVYAVNQRSQGFIDTLKGASLTIVAQEHGDWDLQRALERAAGILKEYPDLKGFYCNNDIMALGVVQAVKSAGKLGQVAVIGTDGIGPAYDSIRKGELTGTIDTFPYQTGRIAVEVALRLLEGQKLPRVVFSPQNLVTRANVDNPLPEYSAKP